MGASHTSADTPPIHATTVAHAGRAVLIRGCAGSGKSGLALQLVALGARLIADDRTVLRRDGDQVIADAPEAIRGRIEARGIGILTVPVAGATPVSLVIDMETEESDRLPPLRETDVLGVLLPLQRKVSLPHFPAAIMAYLEHGRIA